jgi:hypothetical protein
VKWRETPTFLCPLEIANLNHWTRNPVSLILVAIVCNFVYHAWGLVLPPLPPATFIAKAMHSRTVQLIN